MYLRYPGVLTEWPLRLPNEPFAHRMASSPTERATCSPNGLFAYRTSHLFTEWPLRLPNEPLLTEWPLRLPNEPLAHRMASSPTERATCSPNGLFAYRTSHCSPNGLFAYRTSHLLTEWPLRLPNEPFARRMSSSPTEQAICSPNGLFAYRTIEPFARRMASSPTERAICSPNGLFTY